MESVVLSFKYGIMAAFEIFVLLALVVSFILGTYQIIRDKVEETRRVDQIPTDILPDPVKAH